MFPKSAGEAADKKFASFTPGYRRTYYEGVSHGFAVRGDFVRVCDFTPPLSRTSFCIPVYRASRR